MGLVKHFGSCTTVGREANNGTGVSTMKRTWAAIMAACLAGLLAACGSTAVADEQAMGFSVVFVAATDGERASGTEDTEPPPADDGGETDDTEPPPADDGGETGDDGDEVGDDESEDDEDSEGGGLNLLVIAAIVLIIAAIGALLLRGSGRRSGPPPAPRPVRAPAQSIDPDDRALGDISWFNEQLSLDLLASDPGQAQERWRGERPRIDGLARDCQRLEEATGDPTWGAIAAEIVALAQSLDTATAARANPAADPTVTRHSIDVVNRHRSQLSGLSQQIRRR